jgi:putative addiction module component (TIGR02574 family)
MPEDNMNLTDMVALETAALELPRADRVHLAERLIESLDTDDEVLQAWIDESERRLDAIERGEAKTVPFEEVMTELRARNAA